MSFYKMGLMSETQARPLFRIGGRESVRLVKIGGASSYNDVFNEQLKAYKDKRGSDQVAGSPSTVPRTTVADAKSLLAYWLAALQGGPDSRPGDLGGIERSRALLMGEIALMASVPPGKENTVYTRNADLWHAMQNVSTELSVLNEAPTKWDLAKDAIVESAKHLANQATMGLGWEEIWGVLKWVIIVGAIVVGGGIIYLMVVR